MSAPNQPPAGAAEAERVAQAPSAEGDPAAPPFAWPEGADPVLAAFDGSDDTRLDPETVERILDALLRAYPEAPVTPIGEGGVVVPLPDSIPLRDNPVLEARSGMDMVAYDAAVLAAWDRARAVGIARCTYRPLGDPEVTRSLFLIDMREAHGVVLTLSAHKGTGLTGTPPPRPETPELRARFATIRKEASAGILSVDGAFTEILGWTAEDMQSRRSVEFIHPDDQALAIDNWMNMLSAPGPGRRVRLRHRHRDGSWVWLEFTNHNLLADPAHQCVVGEIVDISEEMAAQEELRAREQLLDRLAGAIPVGLLQLDAEGRVVYTNERIQHILGVRQAETAAAQFASVLDADRATLDGALASVLGNGGEADIEIRLDRASGGGVRFCTVNLRPLTLEDGTVSGAIACVADVTDSSRMREELKQRATFDELTGCYNRASIMLALEANIESGGSAADRGVVFVDVDQFKQINDRHGHAVGDQLLRAVAQALRGVVRDGDMVGRIGGDEFLVVCPDIGDHSRALVLAERLAAAAREAEVDLAAGITPQISIGVSWSRGDRDGADALVARADGAMYESKREGSGRPKLAVAA